MELKTFLKERDALARFVKNRIDGGLQLTLEDTDPDIWFRVAFDLGSSPEGYDFWNELDREWVEALEEDGGETPPESLAGMPLDDKMQLLLLLSEATGKWIRLA